VGYATAIDYYSLSTQSWTYHITSIPFSPGACCGAAEYFPDRNSLFVLDHDAGIWEYSFATHAWSGCLINTNSSCGAPRTATMSGIGSTTPPWARYDSLNHRMLFGGNTSVYALSPTLALTTLASSPFTISVVDTGSPVAYDPGTGKLVSFNSSGNTYTSDGTSWTNAGASPFANPVSAGLACGSSTTYNVILCFYAGTESKSVSNARIWLYMAK